MAKVVHFMKDGNGVFCGTKAKSPNTTETFSEVTCKKCNKKMQSTTNNIESFENRKHGYCLEFKGGNLLRLGNNLNDEIGMMLLMGKTGVTSTSMKVANTRGILDRKDEKYLRTYFDTKKIDLGRKPLVSDVFTDFKW